MSLLFIRLFLRAPTAVQRSAYLRLRADEVAFFERLYALGDPQVS
jgi:hypothetical protein